jgi:uncharacterized protein involved in exopolysaccharide biosynthesis
MPTESSHIAPSEQVTSSSNSSTLGQKNDEIEISVLDILIALAEQKWIVFGVTIAFACIAVVVALLLPPRYTAAVMLLPPQQNTSMGAALVSQLGSSSVAALAGGSLGLKNANEMFVAMFKSRTVEDAMVQNFGLMQEYHTHRLSDARKAFDSHATVDVGAKDGLIRVSIDDRDPKRAAELANGYIDQIRLQSQHLAITEAAQRRLFFEKELEQAKNNLADAEEALKRTEQSTGVIELSGQSRALIEAAVSLQAQITAKEVQIQGMRTYATEDNAQLAQAQQELAGMRAQLAKLGGAKDSFGGGLIVPKGQVTEAGLEYVRKLRDVKYYETIYEMLARQFEVAKLDEAKEGAPIQVIDAAVIPDTRSFPKRGIIVITATAVGFFIGVLIACFKLGLRRLKTDAGTMEKLAVLKGALAFRR